MAIAKMRLLSITGPRDMLDFCLEKHIAGKDIHVENAMSAAGGARALFPYEGENEAEPLLHETAALMEEAGIPPAFHPFEEHGWTLGSAGEFLARVREVFYRERARAEELLKLIEESEYVLSQLPHLYGIGVRLEPLFNLTYAKIRFGRLPRGTYNVYKSELERNEKVLFVPTSVEDEFVYGFYIAPRRFKEKIDVLFASLQFSRIRISERARGTPKEAEKNLAAEIAEAQAELETERQKLSVLKEENKARLLSLYSFLKFRSDLNELKKKTAHTSEHFYISAWIDAGRAEAASKSIRAVPGFGCIVQAPESVASGELVPPSRLKNLALFRPFEFFVKTYGIPVYNEVDPTPFMAATYMLLFGMMFGDVGQGLLLVLLGVLYARIKKSELGRIIAMVGASSTAFGFAYGSVFGSEEILPFGFRLLGGAGNINKILLASVALGVVLMSLGMLLNIANGIKQRDPEKILLSARGLAGVALYWGVLAGAISLFFLSRSLFRPAYVLAFIVLPLLLIALARPLGKLIKGKKDWMPERKAEFLLVSVFELFEVAVSFLSNTVSFVRVGALALTHAGMMMVVFILAQGVRGASSVVVLVIGNAFVIALEGFIVAIQCLRLEFYEIFGKFYSGAGVPFESFEVKYKK